MGFGIIKKRGALNLCCQRKYTLPANFKAMQKLSTLAKKSKTNSKQTWDEAEEYFSNKKNQLPFVIIAKKIIIKAKKKW